MLSYALQQENVIVEYLQLAAERKGMTFGQFLQTPVGKAFNSANTEVLQSMSTYEIAMCLGK